VNFSEALHDLKNGFLLRRDAWKTTMYVFAQKGYPEGIPLNANTAEATGLEQGTVAMFSPYLMKQSNDGTFTPWVPSMKDLFAEDWRLFPRQPDAVAAHTFADPEGKTAG
jgi:hypothetical protein